MSWDIVLFSARQTIHTIHEIQEEMLLPIDFYTLLKENYPHLLQENNLIKFSGEGFSFRCFADNEPVSNKIFSLNGEYALFELARFAQKYNLQIFDTGIEAFIDLDNPEKNGYEGFQSYLQHVLSKM